MRRSSHAAAIPAPTTSSAWLDLRRARVNDRARACLLYTSDAADDLLCVDLGGRRILKQNNIRRSHIVIDISLLQF